ncbi:MAG: prolipoprotein diacylglyceryl transferase [Armatimonadota bacterium]|nr:prolipoprotein diacylglyceryl transferase [Armatimonadota bacterium]MDR7468994.1 prolipoprotein diacylglyceryl transferase [Armatimonadota bacterium]MDR7474041.1 prolipoprotein diacylglyceryl transferase [Armatimonadota bacterium]MDR7538035.1 prolipoprotein diacylglyceryl transferase [Armatimonadota bacterium]
MNPVLFQAGPLVVRWYGVMMALTILASILFALRWGPRFGIAREFIDRITFPLALVLFAGARLGYVVSHPGEFADPLEVFRLWHGGLTSHGAIAAGLLYGYLVARRGGVSYWSLADTVVWAIPLGNIFVRFGNFMNGELYGDPTALPWGVLFPTAPDAPRHPLQLYEMALAVVILWAAWRVARRRAFPGQVWWVVVVLTSAGRILLDALRSEEHVILGTLAYGQVAAAILLLAGVWFLWRRPRSSPPQPPPVGADPEP